MVVTVKAEVETFELALRCSLRLVLWFWNSRRIFCDIQYRCVSLWDGDMSRFCGGFIQNFHKGEAYLIKESFVEENFSLENIFVTKPIFRYFSPMKNFFSDMINIFDLN